MLSQTKEQVQLLVGKVQLIDFILGTLPSTHKNDEEAVKEIYMRASSKKIKLLEEILRLGVVSEII